MNGFVEDIYQKHGFIYQIGESFYALGADIFAEVTDTAEIDNIELLQNAVKKNNERQIGKYLDKIIRIANGYRVDAREHLKLQAKLAEFVEELEQQDVEAYQALQKQVFEFDELFTRYSKHSNVNAQQDSAFSHVFHGQTNESNYAMITLVM